MSIDLAAFIDRVRAHYDEGCFACGRENPIGLQMDNFDLADGQVSATFNPREHYRGAGTTLHGGVAATALDEILVWAGILDERVMSVTGKLEIRYRREATVADTILLRVVESRRATRPPSARLGRATRRRRGESGGLGALLNGDGRPRGIGAGLDGHHSGVKVSDIAELAQRERPAGADSDHGQPRYSGVRLTEPFPLPRHGVEAQQMAEDHRVCAGVSDDHYPPVGSSTFQR